MLLFSSPACCWSHRVRLVLAEKGISAEIIMVDEREPPEDLLDLNPFGSVPTLVDRDLVLYDSRVAIEYLDERFPHPPLLPPDPVNRARARLVLTRIEKDWYGLLPQLENAANTKQNAEAKQQLSDGLMASIDVFAAKPFFLSDELSLIDCTLAPLLWRLPSFGITLTVHSKPVRDYAKRLFKRPAFRASLSADERRLELQNTRLYDL
jgi:RNA polymerase-associated protein